MILERIKDKDSSVLNNLWLCAQETRIDMTVQKYWSLEFNFTMTRGQMKNAIIDKHVYYKISIEDSKWISWIKLSTFKDNYL